MALNFNVDPYYDDFDPSKNFHRVLFKPGAAVQARELTQAQTILQNQISNFADSIFSQNTPVTGGKVTTNLNCHYLKLNLQYNNVNITAASFLNKVIQDSTGTIVAKVIATAESTGTSTTAGDPPTLILSYRSGIHFSDATLIIPSDGTNLGATTIGTAGGTSCSGLSSVASISDGVFYVVNGYSQSSVANSDGSFTKYSIGNFVAVQPQTTILSKYSNTPSYRIGLSITETIVDYVNDASLLDPAVGASNYQAPGADRYAIILTLTALPLSLGSDDAFIELVRMDGGEITKQVDSTVYSVIDDYFAKRDFESNGDYIVNDFKLTPSANTINSGKYNLGVGKGVAYVHGYRIENQSPLTLVSDRARTVQTVGTNNVYLDYGNYFFVDTANGTFDVTTMPTVDLHLVPAINIAANNNMVSANANSYNSTVVGTARVRDIQYVSDTSSSNTQTYVYKIFVSNIQSRTIPGVADSTGSSATTIKVNDASRANFSNVANAYYGTTINITGGTSIGDIRTVVSWSGATKIATVSQPFTFIPDATTTFTLNLAPKDVDAIVVKDGAYSFSANANINVINGKENALNTNPTIFGNPGYPEMLFSIGNPYVANLSSSSYTSTKIYRNQSLSSTTPLTLSAQGTFTFVGNGTLSSDAKKQNFIVVSKTTSPGKILDFSTTGNTIAVSSSQATFTTSYYNDTVDIIANINVPYADHATDGGLVLKAKNLVTGNTTAVGSFSSISGVSNTTIDLTFGQTYITKAGTTSSQVSLYVSDVKKIRKIIDTGSSTVSPTAAMLTSASYDVTTQYQLVNGQQDSYYDHAYLKPLTGGAKGNLLVIYDYYNHTGGDGYFSVLSYLSTGGGFSTAPENYAEIGEYTAASGITYALTDVLDFRPKRTNATGTFAFDYATSGNFRGMLLPQDLTQFQSSYSYYLGRKDLLVLSKDKSFSIVAGVPSLTPTFPTTPDGSMLLAKLTLDPYTAYIPGENTGQVVSNLSLQKVSHNRWAKSDISNLQTRVNNLEYYTSLSVLEQSAQSLQVPDVNGLNRFKNGILVDDFSSFGTADTANPDYSANINIRTRQLKPLTPVTNFQLQNLQVLSSLGTLSNTNIYNVSSINGTGTNIFTLPYTKANVVTQPLASSTISLNPFSVNIFQGTAALTPPLDNWVDTWNAPAILISDPNLQMYQVDGVSNALSAGDFATVIGTQAPTGTKGGSTTGMGNGTDTTTYANAITTYNPVSVAMNQQNGYITNVTLLPYIRPQEIGIRSKGLLINTPITTFFDGVNVDQYITSPDTLELKQVGGTFQEDDVVGFFTNNNFYPTARVMGVYNYPGTANTRLYLSTVPGGPTYTSTAVLQRGDFDQNGNYITTSNTAWGYLASDTGRQSISLQGSVTGVGGLYLPNSVNPVTIYKVYYPNIWNSFMNQYAIWGDLNQSTTFTYNNVKWTPAVAGVHTITASSTGTSQTVTANGTSVGLGTLNYSTTTTANYTVTTLGTVTLNVAVTGGTTGSFEPGFAMIIKDPTGTVVYRTDAPPNSLYSGVTGEENLPLGGTYFTGVTTVQLDSKASSANNYYVGTEINITSKYVYTVLQQTATYHPAQYYRSPDGDSSWSAPAYATFANKSTDYSL
jgi:hypothetical protein